MDNTLPPEFMEQYEAIVSKMDQVEELNRKLTKISELRVRDQFGEKQ